MNLDLTTSRKTLTYIIFFEDNLVANNPNLSSNAKTLLEETLSELMPGDSSMSTTSEIWLSPECMSDYSKEELPAERKLGEELLLVSTSMDKLFLSTLE